MISIEIELSEDGYSRLCRLCDRFARRGAAPDIGAVLTLAIMTGVTAQEQALDLSERQAINAKKH